MAPQRFFGPCKVQCRSTFNWPVGSSLRAPICGGVYSMSSLRASSSMRVNATRPHQVDLTDMATMTVVVLLLRARIVG
jgi:hypothetical protein